MQLIVTVMVCNLYLCFKSVDACAIKVNFIPVHVKTKRTVVC